MGKKCIKCGYERKEVELAPETDCPRCGVIYARAEGHALDFYASPEFRNSPKGRARRARNSNRRIFQIDLPISQTTGHSSFLFGTHTAIGDTTDAASVLEQIEGEGWILFDASYVFRPTGSASREKIIGRTELEAVSGQIIGIYLFRATEGAGPHPDIAPSDATLGRTTFSATP